MANVKNLHLLSTYSQIFHCFGVVRRNFIMLGIMTATIKNWQIIDIIFELFSLKHIKLTANLRGLTSLYFPKVISDSNMAIIFKVQILESITKCLSPFRVIGKNFFKYVYFLTTPDALFSGVFIILKKQFF